MLRAVIRAQQHLEQCFVQWFVRNSTALRASCCKAREALRVEILGHAAEQIGRKRIERGRFFSLSVHYHVFGTGAARELSDGAVSLQSSLPKSLARE